MPQCEACACAWDVCRDDCAVAAEEIAATTLRVVGASMGMKVEDIPSAVGRMLGFGRTSAAIETRVNASIQQLVKRGLLVVQGEFLVMPNHS